MSVKNSNSKKQRNFCLTTYLSENQILAVLQKHDMQIKAYAYILHNRDINEDGSPKTEHFHLLIALVNATTVNSVRSWFDGFKDEKNEYITTLAQPINDVSGSYEYLTHNTEGAKAENKYLYSSENVKGFNLDFFKDTTVREIDNLSLAVADMVAGVPIAVVMKRYGRDFIVHYGHVRTLFNDIQKQSGGKSLDELYA